MALWAPSSPAAQTGWGLAVPTCSLPFGDMMASVLRSCTPGSLSAGWRVLGG